MPFKSKKQAAFLFSKRPKIAREFEDETDDFEDLPDYVEENGNEEDDERGTLEEEMQEDPEMQMKEMKEGTEKHHELAKKAMRKRGFLFDKGGLHLHIHMGKKK